MLLSLLVSACSGSDQQQASMPDSNPSAVELTDAQLANLEYKSEFTSSGTAQLKDGNYSEPAAPNSATLTSLDLTEFISHGQVSDFANASAVVLVADPGGSGTFYQLALVVQNDDQPVNVANVMLGDRVKINSVSIEDGKIQVDMVTQGPDDPMCCPSQHVINTYELAGSELDLANSQVLQPH